MIVRCCIASLLLVALPAAGSARIPDAVRGHRCDLRSDTLRFGASDPRFGLARDSVYLRRIDSLHRNDSLRHAVDERNERLYDSIRSKTTRRAVPRMLYRLIFRGPVRDTTAAGRVLDESRLFERYSGRSIAEVVIAQDPVFDPNGSWLERTGNRLHVMTRERVLRRDLLFEPGDTVAPDVLVKNLQLLRSRSYISDARLELTPDPLDSMRVAVTLRTRDSWTISADAALRSEGRTMLALSDANVLGSGNRLSVATHFNRRDLGYGGNIVSYDVPNLLGSFYKAGISAGRDFYASEFRVGVGKEFILPTDYELGVSYENVKEKYYLVDRDTSDLIRSRRFDLWTGYSFRMPSLRSNIYFTARYGFARFLLRPETTASYNPAFHDTDYLLFGLGLYREKFYTTNMIYGFGAREYLAAGYKFEIVGGYSWREFGEDLYLGVGCKAGGFTRLGYVMGGLSLGSFIDQTSGRWTQSAVDVGLRWFSPLFLWGRSHIRQFLSLDYTQGWNRLRGADEVIRFTEQDGLSLLKKDIFGTNRMVLNTETVFFTPYQPLGFRIAVFGFADFGLLGHDANTFRNEFYTTFGLGIRLRNERLVFSTIQLRLGVAFGKGGWVDDCRYVQLSNGTRFEQYRYLPTLPEIVRFR